MFSCPAKENFVGETTVGYQYLSMTVPNVYGHYGRVG